MKSAFSQVRAVLRNRDRPVPADIAYRAYLVVMLGIIVLAPLVRGAALWLTEVLPEAGDPRALQLVLECGLALLVVLPIIGWYASPVRMPLPELDLLFTSALPRSRLLAGRVIRGGMFSLAIGVAAAGLLVSVRMMQSGVSPVEVVRVLLTGAGAGPLSFLLMIVGQVCRGTRWQVLREQARRLDTVSALVMTGELRGAAGRLGAPVNLGRSWGWAERWVADSNAHPGAITRGILLFASRDLIGIFRAPLRSIVALVGTAGAGALAAAVLVTLGVDGIAALGEGNGAVNSEPSGTTVGVVSGAALGGMAAMLVAYVSIGPWCRGLRAAGEMVGAAPVLPYSDSGLLLRHLTVPASLSAFVCVGSSVIAALNLPGTSGTHLAFVAISGLMLSLISLTLRLLGALKGPLPQSLLAPVPTPAGDLSGLNVMLWSLDGPIIAAALGAGLFAIGAVAPTAGLIIAAIAVAVLLVWSSVRLQRTHTA